MFALREPQPGEANLKHAWAERSLARAIQLGEYGVHFVPSPPDVGAAEGARRGPARARAHPRARPSGRASLILDTKSDLEALTAERLARRRPHPGAGRRPGLARGGRARSSALLERVGARHASARAWSSRWSTGARRGEGGDAAALRAARRARCAGAAGPATRPRSRAARASSRSTRAPSGRARSCTTRAAPPCTARCASSAFEVLGDLELRTACRRCGTRPTRWRTTASAGASRGGDVAPRCGAASGARWFARGRESSAEEQHEHVRDLCRGRPGARHQRRDRRRRHPRVSARPPRAGHPRRLLVAS